MADNAIDTRIVEAKFDASDFKKGVDQTIKKLDELKEKLQLKDTEKSITEVSQKTQEATEKTSKSLDKLTDRLTTFTGMVKQQLLSGFAEKVSGVFFRIENSITSLVRSMSTQQISVGMRKYEQMLTSVRIMMSAGKSQSESYAAIEKLAEYSDQTSYSLDQMTDAMSKMVAAGVDLDVAAKSVEGISNACANAGINATDASRAFYNLSQAYSSGSLKYTDYRSLELLNMTTKEFKQQMLDAAVAAGTLKKSTKGIYTTTNKKNKKVTSGKKVTLESLSDSLRYGFMDKEAMNQLFGTEYFFDEQALDKIYEEHNLKHGNEADRKKAFEIAEKEYGKVAVSAYRAAKEARSFTDVMNTFKDVISTGWSKSFELLIGKLEKATEFFTWLTENNLAEAIYSIGEYRNSILEVFGAGHTDSILGIWGNSGRDNIILGLKELDEIFGKVSEQFAQFIPHPKILGFRLRDLSRDFLMATQNMSKWLDSRETKEGPTRLERIGEVAKSVANIISDFATVIKSAFGVAGGLISNTFKYIFGIGDEVDGVSKKGFDGATRVGKAFGEFQNILDSVHQTLKPVVEFLQKILDIAGKVAQFLINMAVDTFLMNLEWIADIIGLIVELLGGTSGQKINEGVGVIEGLNNSIHELSKACTDAWMAVHDFFNSLIKDFKNLLGVNKEGETTGESSGPFSSLISYFQNNEYFAAVKEWILKAFQDVKNFILDIPNKIGKFTETIENVWNSLLWEEKSFWDIDEKGNKKRYTVKVRTQFGKLVDDIVNEVKAFVISIPTRVKDFFHNIPNMWNSLLWDEKTLWDVDEKGKKKKYTVKVRTAFGKVIDSVARAIVKFIRTIPTYIRKAIKGVGSIFRSIVNVLLGRDTNTDGQKKTSEEAKSGIAKFFEDIFKDFSLSKVISYITDIGKTILNEIASIFTGTDDVETNQEWFANTIANGITWIKTKAVEAWDTIKNWFINLPTTIANVFKFGGKDGKASPIVTSITNFANTIGKKIEEIPGIIKSFVDNASKELEKIWASLYEAITGKKSVFNDSLFDKALSVVDDKKLKKRTLGDEIVEVLSKAASDVKTKLLDFVNNTLGPWFQNAWDEIGKLWDNLYNWLRGKIVGDDGAVSDRGKIDPSEAINDSAPTEPFDGKDGPWQTFIDSVRTFFTTAFRDIGTWITQAIDLGLSGMKKGVENLGNILNTIDLSNVFGWGNDKTSEIQNRKDPEAFEALKKEALSFDEIIKKITEGMSEEDTSTLSPLLSAVLNLGHTIYEIITTTIPEFIKNAWEFISRNATSAWDYLSKTVLGWINDASGRSGTDKEFQNFGEVVQRIIHRMTIYITAAWWWVKRNVKKGWDYVKDLFTSWVKDEGARNGSKTEINNFGDAVKLLITEIIPTKISKAYEDIKTNVVNIWTSLGGIFEEWAALNEEENPVKKKVGEIGLTLYTWITETIPTFIRNAFNYVKRLFTGKTLSDDFAGAMNNAFLGISSLVSGKNQKLAERFMRERPTLTDAAKTAVEKPEEKPEESGIVGWINEIISAIGEAFKNAGPVILEGLTNAFNWIGEKLTHLGGILGIMNTKGGGFEEATTEYFDEQGEAAESPIRNAIIQFGKSLYHIFVEVIPGFLGEAFAFLLKEGSNIIGKFFTSFSESIQKDAGGKDAKQAAENIGETVVNSASSISGILDKLLDMFTNPETAGLLTKGTEAIVGLLIITKLVDGISSLIRTFQPIQQWADKNQAKRNNIWDAIKWIGLTLMSMAALVAYVASMDPTHYEQAINMLDRLLPFLDKIITLITIINGMSSVKDIVGNVSDVIGKGMDLKETKELIKTAPSKLNSLTELAGKLGDVGSEVAGSGVGSFFNSLFAGGTAAVLTTGIGAIAEQLSSNFSEILMTFGGAFEDLMKNLDSALKYAEGVVNKFITGKTAIEDAIALAIQAKELVQYNEDIKLAAETLTSLSGGIGNLSTAIGDSPASDTFDKVKNFLQFLMDSQENIKAFGAFSDTEDFQKFKLGIASLGAAMSFYSTDYSDIDENGDGITKIIGILKKVFGNEELAGLAQEITDQSMIGALSTADAYKAEEFLVLLAGSIASLAKAAREIESGDSGKINQLFSLIDELKFGENDDPTSIAQKIGELGVSLGTFARETSGFNKDNVETTNMALEALGKFVQALSDIDDGWFKKMTEGNYSLSVFSNDLNSFSNSVNKFFRSMTYIDPENTSKGKLDLIIDNYNVLERFFNLMIETFLKMNIFQYSDGLHKILEALGVKEENTDLTLIARIIAGMGEGVKLFMDQFKNYKFDDDADRKQLRAIQVAEGIIESFGSFTAVIWMWSDKFRGMKAPDAQTFDRAIEALRISLFGTTTDYSTGISRTSPGLMGTILNFIFTLDEMYISLLAAGGDTHIFYNAKEVAGLIGELFDALGIFNTSIEEHDTGLLGWIDAKTQGASILTKLQTTALDYEEVFKILDYFFSENGEKLKGIINDASNYSVLGIANVTNLFMGINNLINALVTAGTNHTSILSGIANLKLFPWDDISMIANEFSSRFFTDMTDDAPMIKYTEIGSYMVDRVLDGVQMRINEEGTKNRAYELAQALSNAFDAAGDDLIKPVISPVVDLNDVNSAKGKIWAMFGEGLPASTIDLSTSANMAKSANPDNAVEEAIDYTDSIRDVKIEIAGLASHIDGVAEKIGGMSVSIDKGKLVGEIIDPIDVLLGKRHYFARRGS